MKRSSVKWVAAALLLSLALQTATSIPDDKPEAAAKAEESKADGASAATENVASDNHYRYNEGEYEAYGPGHDDDHPWVEGHKGYKKHEGDHKPNYYKKNDGVYKPDYYRGEGHMGGDGYYHKQKHHGYYPKPPAPTPPPPPPPAECDACPTNLTQCDSLYGFQCFDLKAGAPFCGSCNVTCPDGAICNNGTCECTGELSPCLADDNSLLSCVNLPTDQNNCGTCSYVCNATQFCNNTVCDDIPVTPPCSPGLTQCFPSESASGTCVNKTSDPFNCGRCGKNCLSLFGTGGTCTNSECYVAPGGSCLIGPQCCGFNPLSIIPGTAGELVPTSRCEATGDFILPRKCCLGRFKSCGSTSDCCEGLTCSRLLGTCL